MVKEKKAISSASVKLKSTVYVESVSPKGAPSIGIICTKDQAVQIATNLLSVAHDITSKGMIILTGWNKRRNVVSIIRNKK